MLQWLTLQARAEEAGDGDEHTALDYVVHWLESGLTLRALARKIDESLTPRLNPPLGDNTIARALKRGFGEAASTAALATARRKGAVAKVEESEEISDEPVASSEDAARQRSRIASRQWQAERYDRDQFGQPKQGVTVTVNVAAMHLDALRRREVARAHVIPSTEAEILEPIEGAHTLPELGAG